MSYMFTLSDKESILSTKIHPPITLDDDATYVLGLIDFVSYNTIPNVDKTNNKFHYYSGGKLEEITLAEGSYEIGDIEKFLNRQIKKREAHSNRIVKEEEHTHLMIKPNMNTLRCEIKWCKQIDFTRDISIGSLLGFDKKKLPENVKHISDHPIDIFKVNAICVDCNLISNSYSNNKLIHIIHMFYPTVAPGFKIIQHPSNVIYLPVNARVIDEICVKILDQDGRLVNFNGELVTVRLHLKKFS